MASVKSIKLFQYINIGYNLHLTPLKHILINKDNIVNLTTVSVLNNQKDKLLYYIVASCNIGIRLCLLGFGCWYEFKYSPRMAESCVFYFLACLEGTSLTIQLTNLFFVKTTLILAEFYNVFVRKFCKLFDFKLLNSRWGVFHSGP